METLYYNHLKKIVIPCMLYFLFSRAFYQILNQCFTVSLKIL